MELIFVGLFFVQFFVLYLISRITITKLFYVLHRLIPSEGLIYSIIAFIFFPGTVIHELSHFLMAIILFLRVRDIHVFPEWDGKYLKLGRVIYEKKDVVRSILVGIAPVIVGILLLWWLYSLNIFSIESLYVKGLVVFFIFILSTTMFSSKQDLVDIIYIIPISALVFGVIYVFNIDIFRYLQLPLLLEGTRGFVYAINIYLAISIAIHLGTISILNTILFITKKI